MDGIIIINKPSGCTSHDIVSKIRKKLNIKKVGHTGTLDPLATGVLPILLGNATKLSKYLINHDKEYIATIKLGVKTDTADIEGIVLEKQEVPQISEKQIIEVLDSCIGKQKQIPPMYSAIKVKGKKLYEYARNGENIEVEPRDIEIYNIELIQYKDNNIKFKVACSKGTYIRSLCENIAQKLNTIGTMLELKRTQVGIFKIEEAAELEELLTNGINEENLITTEKLFAKRPKVILNQNQLKSFLNGVKLKTENEDGIYRIYAETNNFIGLGEVKNRLLKRDFVV